MLPRVIRPPVRRPKTIIDLSRKTSIVRGIILFLNFKFLELEKASLEKRLVQVGEKEADVKQELKEVALNLLNDFIKKI